MPRQSFEPLRRKLPGGHVEIGTPALGQRPELETIICHCLMEWPNAESEMGLLLGQLLGIHNTAALAVFQSLRRASNQRQAIEAAAKLVLNEKDLELLTAMLDVHKKIEKERTALSHGHFGVYDKLRDAILWLSTQHYIEMKAKWFLANIVVTEQSKQDFFSGISVYRSSDLLSIFEDIKYLGLMWVLAINWLRTPMPQHDKLYLHICDEPHIRQVLETFRRKNNREAQPLSPSPVDDE